MLSHLHVQPLTHQRDAHDNGCVVCVLMQLVIAFGQTMMHLPAVYSLKLPDAYYDRLGFLDIFEIDWSGIAIPGECLEGGFRSRLWLRGIGPLALMALAFLFGWMGRIVAHFVRRSKESVPWRTSMHKALPPVLFITFVFVAGTSSSIFAVWTCESFDEDSLAQPPVKVAFLRADTSLSACVQIRPACCLDRLTALPH